MANLISDLETDGIRVDLDLIIGRGFDGDTSLAKTTCTIRRDSLGALNPTTAVYTNTPVTIYDGPCEISPIIYRRDRTETAGGEAVKLRNYRVLVPYDAGDIRLHDVLTVTGSTDNNMIGREFIVTDVIYGSENAARRLTVQDIADT